MSITEFEITKGPSIGSKDHVILKSLSELRRLCHLFNIPLMHMDEAHFSTEKDSYNIFFAYMSGLYYAYIEHNGEAEGVSS